MADFNDLVQQSFSLAPNSTMVQGFHAKYLSCDNLNVNTKAAIASGVTITNTPTTITLIGTSDQINFQPGGTGTQLQLNATNPATASRVVTFPDPGAAANVIYDVSAQTLSGAKTFSTAVTLVPASNQLVFQPSGAGNTFTITCTNPAASRTLTIMDDAVNGNIMVDGTGGAVTQATSTTTAVTLNKRAGLITMQAALSGAGSVSFTLNDTYITATSRVLCWISNTVSGTSKIAPSVVASAIGAGSCTLTVTNNDGTNALAAAAIVQFIVI